mgnify:FL=1
MIQSKSIFLLICSILGLFAFLFLFYYLLVLIGGENLKNELTQWWITSKGILLENAFFLFLSIAVLPGFILPVAPLLTLAGLWAEQHGAWTACMYCIVSLTINLSWTYWIARGPARALLIRLLHKTKFNLPSSPPSNLFQWALILRLTPGVPFIFSNYGLGVLQMPFISYLLISVPIIGITACGYVLTFAGIFTGNWSYIWFGICLIAIMIIAGRIAVKGRQHAD